MQRNTLLFIVFLAIFAAIVVGVNLGRKTAPPSSGQQVQMVSPTPTLIPTPTQTFKNIIYQDRGCGVSFEHPENYTKVDIETGGAIFVNEINTKNAITLMCQKTIPKPSLAPENAETIKIGTIAGTIYHDKTKDGQPMNKFIFIHPIRKIEVLLSTPASLFESLINSLKIF